MACHQLLENEHVQTQDSLQGRVGKTKGWSPGGQFLILTIVSAWMLLGLNEKEISTEAQRCKRTVKGSKRLTFCRSRNPVPPTPLTRFSWTNVAYAFFAPILTLSPQGLNDYPDALLVAEGSLRSSLDSSGIGGTDLVGIWAAVSILPLTVQGNGHSLNRPGH